jgi:hypothetical protein
MAKTLALVCAAKRGGQKSASIRKAASLAGAKRIWDRWKLPSDEHKTAGLLAEAGISRNTMNAHYGCTREVAQARYQAALKLKATKDRQKEGSGTMPKPVTTRKARPEPGLA